MSSQPAPTAAARAHEPESARRAATRTRLLDAAYEVFSQVGLQAATVEQITEQAGFTRGAFYSNFTSMAQLFLALTERETNRQLDALRARMDHLPDAALDEEQLAEGFVDLLSTAICDRRWAVVMEEYRMAAVRNDAIAADFLARRAQFIASVRAIADPALALAGREFALDPDLACRIIVNTFVDMVRDAVIAGADPTDTRELRLTVARVCLAMTRPVH